MEGIINNKSWIILILCWLLASSCNAQSGESVGSIDVNDSSMFVAIDRSYPFIQYDQNHLILNGDSTAFRKFAEKWYHLLATGEGHINIVQLGASHVQGGSFPHRIRRNLLLPLDSYVAARGLIFPYSAALKCNNPFDYRVSRSRPLTLTRSVFKTPAETLGLTGIAVTAENEPADIGIALNEPKIDFATSRIILLGYARGNVVPKIRYYDADKKSVTLEPNATDTLLRRYTFELGQAVDSFHIVLPCREGQAFVLTGVYLDNDKPGISYHSIGVNGASLIEYTRKCPYMTRDLQLLQPDLVIFGIGINDAAGSTFDTVVFRKRYQQLVDSIHSVNPDCAFIFVTNNDSFRRVKKSYEVNTNALLAREVFMRLSRLTGGAVWDQFTVMGGLKSMDTWQQNDLAQRDRIHFTRKGYELIGDLLSNALFETLMNLRPEQYRGSDIRKEHHKKTTDPQRKSTTPQEKKDERFDYISY